VILETYTTLKGDDLHLPDYLEVIKEVTDNPSYSMFNLSKKDGGSRRTSPLPPSSTGGSAWTLTNGEKTAAGGGVEQNGLDGPLLSSAAVEALKLDAKKELGLVNGSHDGEVKSTVL